MGSALSQSIGLAAPAAYPGMRRREYIVGQTATLVPQKSLTAAGIVSKFPAIPMLPGSPKTTPLLFSPHVVLLSTDIIHAV
jgi:hypothetical protein